MAKYVSRGHCAPAIARLPSGTYIVPDFILVPDGTTLDQVHWDRPVIVTTKATMKVPGKSYTLTKFGNRVSCDCPGYTFRKTCKHQSLWRG